MKSYQWNKIDLSILFEASDDNKINKLIFYKSPLKYREDDKLKTSP